MEYEKVRPAALISVVALGFAAQRITQTVLDGFYARSGYPVPYYVGQLSFSAGKLSGWYAEMRRHGTLGVYWQTQFVDFAFIAATMLFFTALLVAVARAFPAGSRGRRIGRRMVWFGVAAPLFDVLENLFSFVMLPDPAAISPTVALLYSTAAALKFACFVVVYLWTAGGLSTAGIQWIRNRRAGRSSAAAAAAGTA
ncbi:hypothetical protein [Actinoplanes sp. L3-i22]|uniref:hypothetical protein n=1 Tax=Actinoplanes sp. L3-i22 TaxID=2836373 RepID=UPI001C78D603|nr:hypothetical protein [Actinoplanes sp. L3-i22]BCY05320.1 hypothetical protein L3i22_004080 [Actinoplanes sp. L3-i22]